MFQALIVEEQEQAIRIEDYLRYSANLLEVFVETGSPPEDWHMK